MLTFKLGNVVEFTPEKKSILFHCCNDSGGYGSGVAYAIAKKWPHVKEQYHYWFEDTWERCTLREIVNIFKLGQIQLVPASSSLLVCNSIGQASPGGETINGVYLRPIRLQSLEECMLRVAEFCTEHGYDIIGPKFASLRAGGRWDEEIVPLIEKHWSNIDVTIFEYDERSDK